MDWRRLVAALVTGAALSLISPPVGWAWLHWVVFLPLLLALDERDVLAAAALGWVAGYAGVSTLFFWLSGAIVRFSNVPAWASFQVVHLFAFVFALPYAVVFGAVHPLRRRLGTWWVAVVPALQVAVEYLSPALFPYYQGVSQYRSPWVWQLASVTGVCGVSYLVMLVNCALAELAFRRREGRAVPWRVLGVVAALFCTNLGFGARRTARVDALVASWPVLRVSQLQEAVTMEERLALGSREATLSWLRLTQKLRGQPLDLVVWPEGATPYDPRQMRVAELMRSVVRELHAPVLFGGGYAQRKVREATGKRYVESRNSVYLMDERGRLVDRYDKLVPLPFGEYIPFSDTFPVLKDLIEGPGDFAAGDRGVRFEVDGVGITTPICYEAILSQLVRRRLSSGELIVNVTNDAWFGDTAAPHQHAMLAAVRAVELGIPLYRLGYTGVSMVVTPTGRSSYETRPFAEVARVIDVPVGRVETPYRRLGDWFPVLCIAGVLLAAAIARVTRGDPEA